RLQDKCAAAGLEWRLCSVDEVKCRARRSVLAGNGSDLQSDRLRSSMVGTALRPFASLTAGGDAVTRSIQPHRDSPDLGGSATSDQPAARLPLSHPLSVCRAALRKCRAKTRPAR